MKVFLNGWWHPCTMEVRVKINNITEAEKLRDFLVSMGETVEAKNVQKHINFQAEFGVIKEDAYGPCTPLEYTSTEEEWVKKV